MRDLLFSQLKGLAGQAGLGLLSLGLAIAPSTAIEASVVAAPEAPLQNKQPVSQKPPNANTLLEMGRTQGEAGRFSSAASLWQRAVAEYRRSKDVLGAATSLSYLSYAYLQLGQLQEATRAIEESKTLLQQAAETVTAKTIRAGALNTEGFIQLAMGEAEAAKESFGKAAALYESVGDEAGKLGAQINQAGALQKLGLYRRARKTLEQINSKLQSQPDSSVKATGLQSLGVALQVLGDLERSKEVLEQSLAIADRLRSNPAISATLFSLGNSNFARGDIEAAIDAYQRAAEKATGPLEETEARIRLLRAYIEEEMWAEARDLLPQIQDTTRNLKPSRMSAYAAVSLANSWMKLPASNPEQQTQEIGQLLARTVERAQSLNDKRAESLALKQLAELYGQTEQWKEAQKIAEKGLLIAQEIDAEDITASLQGQLGKILQKQGDDRGAIAAYSSAVNSLQSLRSDLVAINSDVQFSFRDTVEPIYRELVGLLVKGDPSQKNLKQARKTIESLQLAELDNFFREACLDAKPKQIDEIDPTAAAIYPIILSDRLEVIVSIPGKPLRHHQIVRPKEELNNTFEELLGSLSLAYPTPQRLSISRTVYEWIIGPLEIDGALEGIKTLVFVLDGTLRNVPMAALYDGEKYLLEKYSVALSQGLQLLEPQALDIEKLGAVTAGLSQARQGFDPLPNVESELARIDDRLESQTLLNEQFTSPSLQKAIVSSPFPVVHLATHGQFSSRAEDTFLLTWDGRIDVKEFDELLGRRSLGNANPIELLVLSACETAYGDDRAVLGLAGIAVRSGARSTLATLWPVRDESTSNLMTQFYQELAKPGVTKAEALRRSQLSLLEEESSDHPFFWAPFILVGNWL